MKKINTRKNVRNEDLYNEIVKSKQRDELTPEAVDLFLLMIHKASTKFKYKNPDDRQDCMSEAISEVIKRWRSFNEVDHTNAFAYYSTVIFNGMCKGYNDLYPKNRITTVPLDINGYGIYNI